MNIPSHSHDDVKLTAFPRHHLPIEAEEDVVRWLAHLGYGPSVICQAINWFKLHGTMDSCPHIVHTHARSASAVATFCRQRAVSRIIASN